MTTVSSDVAQALPARMQLRILSGCHQGATLDVSAAEALRAGAGDDCDVLLRDCGLDAGAAVLLAWEAQHWSMQTAGSEAAPVSQPLGAVALLGRISITLCVEHAPWQVALAPPEADEERASPQQEQVLDVGAAPAPEAPPASANAVAPATGLATGMRRAGRWAVVALAVVVPGVIWFVWSLGPASAHSDTRITAAVAIALSPQAQAQAVKEASLALALVDPALRLRVESRAEGGVTVSGWVDNVEQFDRLAQGLSGLRPLPRLAVRTANEVLDSLADAGSAQGVKLQFSLLGAGKVQVRGVVTTPEERNLMLKKLRARVPEGIEIVDALRAATEQGPAVRNWLQAQGFLVTRADWDGEQLLLGVDVKGPQRGQLERLLASAATPLTDVPFLLQTRLLKADAQTQPERVRIGDAGLPIRIRSVVGGAAPYVVLVDGAKLQPGSLHAGWRLVAIAPDHLVLDGPKRLEISR